MMRLLKLAALALSAIPFVAAAWAQGLAVGGQGLFVPGGTIVIGTTPVSGCAVSGALLYSNASNKAACSANTDGGGGTISGASAATPGLSVAGTLNTTGNVDGAALFASITNTASGASSKLVDLKVGASSVFSVSLTGAVTAENTGQNLLGAFQFDQGGISGASRMLNNGGALIDFQSNVTGDMFYFEKGGVTKIWTINASRNLSGVPINLKSYTVSTLPAGSAGDTAAVTDAAACTFGGALTGGGSTFCPVVYNGASWIGG